MVIEPSGVDEFAQSTLRSEYRLEDQKTEKYKKIIDELMRAISNDWQEQNPNYRGKLAVE